MALGFLLTFASALVAAVGKAVSWAYERADSKVCPQCGETVRRRAAICRFCKYTFPDVPPPP
ncbi:MAG: hypothetical protein HYU87_11845 [Chloroflexi bacterium]|nr:hypothetical protein [Chloroflexota bacterium]